MTGGPGDTPRLRSVEAFPVEQDGQRFVALRDQAGYTDAVLLLPVAVVEMVALFDGRHSLLDIQAEMTRRHGEIVPRSDIEAVVAGLDQHGFLDSPRFAERRAQVDAEFRSAPTRPATHAGGAYAGDPAALRAAMDGFFDHPDGPGPAPLDASAGPPVRGLIAPHIDFHRGGPAYAWGYRDLARRCDADLFVIFGTCHSGMRDPFALTRKAFDTPLGPAAVDRDVVDAIAARAGQDCFGSETAHRREHSIEFQAVFLRYLFGGDRDFTIVPVLTSFAHECLVRRQRPDDDPRVPRFLDALAGALAASGRRVAFIAGADLAHVGPRFGDAQPVSAAQCRDIERDDRAMLESVQAGDAAGFFASIAADDDRRRICGFSPIYALLRVLPGTPGDLRRYGQWPDPQGLVSFASVVY
jgi:AmmeMemoRadiSam system protein B